MQDYDLKLTFKLGSFELISTLTSSLLLSLAVAVETPSDLSLRLYGPTETDVFLYVIVILKITCL